MEHRATFAYVFVAAMGATVYVGYRWKSAVAGAVVQCRKKDVSDGSTSPRMVPQSDKGSQTDLTSVDNDTQTTTHDKEERGTQTDSNRDFEEIEGEIPCDTYQPNAWLEKIWG